MGWHPGATAASFWLAVIVLVLWILPKVRWEAKVVSFTFTVGHFYLNTFSGVHSPWYVPTLTLLAIVGVCTVVNQLMPRTEPSS